MLSKATKEKIKRTLYPLLPATNLRKTMELRRAEDPILLRWHNRHTVGMNWGDKLNPVIVRKVSGRPVFNYYDVFGRSKYQKVSAIGSSLGSETDPDMEIWGTGFVGAHRRPLVAPKTIHAVRGALTRDKYHDHGIDCPSVYGDPALLCRRYFAPAASRTHRIGIIPQWHDKDLEVFSHFQGNEDIKIIDILGSIEGVIEEVTSCEHIISTSLHGVIAADSYGIPSAWAKVSSNVARGDPFKFLDYHSSLGETNVEPARLQKGMAVGELASMTWKKDVPEALLDDLLAHSPFASRSQSVDLAGG